TGIIVTVEEVLERDDGHAGWRCIESPDRLNESGTLLLVHRSPRPRRFSSTRRASFTLASVGKAAATSASRTMMFEWEASRPRYLPRDLPDMEANLYSALRSPRTRRRIFPWSRCSLVDRRALIFGRFRSGKGR